MYQPKFNSVLVEINDKDAAWGSGNDESMLGKSYHAGKLIAVGKVIPAKDYSFADEEDVRVLEEELSSHIGQDIIWNEGDEAGTTFEDNGKLYGMVYWWSIRGVKQAS